ncbi:hypothetical protein Peur_015934 [Populus x canadensis]
MSSSHQSEAGSEAKRVLMDLNQSMEFDLAADDPSAQVENVLPVNSSMLPYHQATEEHHRQDLELFWNQQLSEISNATAFKSSHLYIASGKDQKSMKSDGDVKAW